MQITESDLDELYKNLGIEVGIEEGDDFTYFDFCNCCEDVNLDPDDIDIDSFYEKYNIHIG